MTISSVSTEESQKNPKQMSARDLAEHCAQLAFEKKAMNVVLLEINGRSTIADYFLIMSASSAPQVGAIADNILRDLKNAGYKRVHEEGVAEGRWGLIDLGDVIIHIFQDHMRDFYNLEDLWQDAKRIRLEEKR